MAEGDVLDMRLSLFVVRRLLGRRPSVADLHTVDATLSEQLAWITDNSIDDVLYLNFAVEDPDTGEVIHELIAGGATREVTDANKREYVSAMVDYKLNYELEAQMQVREGSRRRDQIVANTVPAGVVAGIRKRP